MQAGRRYGWPARATVSTLGGSGAVAGWRDRDRWERRCRAIAPRTRGSGSRNRGGRRRDRARRRSLPSQPGSAWGRCQWGVCSPVVVVVMRLRVWLPVSLSLPLPLPLLPSRPTEMSVAGPDRPGVHYSASFGAGVEWYDGEDARVMPYQLSSPCCLAFFLSQ